MSGFTNTTVTKASGGVNGNFSSDNFGGVSNSTAGLSGPQQNLNLKENHIQNGNQFESYESFLSTNTVSDPNLSNNYTT